MATSNDVCMRGNTTKKIVSVRFDYLCYGDLLMPIGSTEQAKSYSLHFLDGTAVSVYHHVHQNVVHHDSKTALVLYMKLLKSYRSDFT